MDSILHTVHANILIMASNALYNGNTVLLPTPILSSPSSYFSLTVLLTHVACSHLKNLGLAIPLASTSSHRAPSPPCF